MACVAFAAGSVGLGLNGNLDVVHTLGVGLGAEMGAEMGVDLDVA